jgi:eukaryotic-like serine/threonine-protein kinase
MTTLESLRKLLRYELTQESPTGKGGCGHVWPARDLLFNRKVALKTIDDTLLWDVPDEAQRSFKKEAAAGARLGEMSRNIVKVYDVGRVDDVLFFAMEWIEAEVGATGIDVSRLMGRVSLARAIAILTQISDAVSTAHAQKIVHSDIAPWNIVYDAKNAVYKLADFGLLKIIEARLLSRASGDLLMGGRRDFQPPAVRMDARRISYSTDVYAMTVTFRVLLEGSSCLGSYGGQIAPTPGVIRISHEQRDAPPQVMHLVSRFIDGHSESDTIAEFASMLQRIPN